MKLRDNEIISAQVILRSASGKTPGPTAELTARTLRQYLPSADESSKVIAALEECGFEVGPLVGIGFSLTGPTKLFEEVFAVELIRQEDGSLAGIDKDRTPSPELPITALTAELQQFIANVIFEPPVRLA